MQGVLLVNKPSGWTSFDVVGYVRKTIASEQNLKPSTVKVGHAGTLDPLADGLLIILIGKSYTKMAGDLTKLDKEYQVTLKLGSTTPSGDSETELQQVSNKRPSKNDLLAALKLFTGTISQQPPIYSALKVNGQRAYRLAREGKEVKLQPRSVTIHRIELTDYNYPEVKLTTKVSSGTYIRSLVVDIGQQLTTGAYMSGLTRTSIGNFQLADSLGVEGLDYQTIAERLIFF